MSEDFQIEQLAWPDRSNTIGYLPGKGSEQTKALRSILEQLPLGGDQELRLMSAAGKPRNVDAERFIVQQLTRGAFVYRDATRLWRPTEAVARWLKSSDNLLLARHLHANVKYFGEMLNAIDDGSTTSTLVSTAGKFGLHWTSTDQVHRRLSWFQSLGLLERWGYTKLVVTDTGRDLLELVDLVAPEDARPGESDASAEEAELPEPHGDVKSLLDALSPDSLLERKVLIGYIPKGRNGPVRSGSGDKVSPVDAVRRFVEILGSGATFDEFSRRAVEQLNQKKSSFTQSLHTFRNLQLVDLVTYNKYAPTPIAEHVLEIGNEVDLARFLHARYRIVFELLSHMHETVTVSELARIAQQDYRCSQIDGAEVRTRLGFLAEAGLVERIDWTRYRATGAGLAMVASVAVEMPGAQQRGDDLSQLDDEGPVGEISPRIADELRRCSRLDKATYEDFEAAVARAFEMLGFKAEHIGGSGNTDVLVTTDLSVEDRYCSIVDAKASASGQITDSAVKFDALKDHMKKHNAEFGMIVGPEFAGRVKDWALNNKFTLLSVDELITVLDRHERAPLTLQQLREMFSGSASVMEALEELYESAEYNVRLTAKLMDLLLQEANEEDPVAGGYISMENLHFALRKEVFPRPGKAQIEACLELLNSPVVSAVVKSGDRFRLVDSPSNVARRLSGIASGFRDLKPNQDSV